MKAVDAKLLELLKKSNRFVVPIYQRVYSWGTAECDQLWDDIVRAGESGSASHFTGSIVYIERDERNNVSMEPDLIIDGQQRLTTVTLIMAALAARLDELPEEEREPIPGFAPRKIRGIYLTNEYEEGEDHFKLTLTQSDKDELKSVIRGQEVPVTDSRVGANFRHFVEKLRSASASDLVHICQGIDRLVVVDVKLTRGVDDPQLVFESMNATGKKLSQADLIRNFVLMDLPPNEQVELFEEFWYPMEQRFRGDNSRRFDDFVRDYLTIKTGNIPRKGDIHDAFKDYAYRASRDSSISRRDLVEDLSRYAKRFAAMALGEEDNPRLGAKFSEIEQLGVTVAYPFLLKVYTDYDDGSLSAADFEHITASVISYLFRRNVCGIPTNSLNKTFGTLTTQVDLNDYADSVFARLITLPTYRRFPTDEEFEEALKTTDVYNRNTRKYLLGKLENFERKEHVSVGDYTIEHIMPQTMTPEWEVSLGDNWEAVHDRFLHTLGNLTLTGYNPDYSNKPFVEKRDMEGGFAHSPLRLNRGLGLLDTWNASTIKDRANRLAAEAIKVWSRPEVAEPKLADYRHRFEQPGGFDWSTAHAILDKVPAGRWMGYYALAEAVGTSAQALGVHLANCRDCPNPYRVLSWDGRVSEHFRWPNLDDTRAPEALLVSEGVRIIDGTADPDQALDTEELLALIDEDPSE